MPFAVALVGNEYNFLVNEIRELSIRVDHLNTAAIRYNLKMGFKQVSKDDCYLYMSLSKAEFLLNQQKLEKMVKLMFDLEYS